MKPYSDAQFKEAYAQLNAKQKLAVDTIEGPVMVIAGPGTGKTQVLAVRIANILVKTDTKADGILCLTFTNSGVKAMRERLRTYIGPAASRVSIATFHSFAMVMIEEFFRDLGLLEQPALIDDTQSVALCDEILHSHDWQHIRTRANPAMYFRDIKSLISLLKRERMTPESFDEEIQNEIDFLNTDDSSISSRGASKGQLKQEVVKKLESLERTREIVEFYRRYEALKTERNLFDYDDVLENLVKLVEVSEEAASSIRERYQYVLVDEHQDSSGIQNEFLSSVWGDEETQNLFVVGDDRQLIYGFGGASLSYFEGFRKTFRDVQVITLTDNYRSTQAILDTADALLHSSLADAPLLAHTDDHNALQIVEAQYPRDEIIRAGLSFAETIERGTDPSRCAILVPKNAQVRTAIRILQDMGVPVAAGSGAKLFETGEAQSMIAILETLAHPFAPHLVARTLLDPLSKIPPLAAHAFLSSHDLRKLTLATLLENKQSLGLYPAEDAVAIWAGSLSRWLDHASTNDIQGLIQIIGNEVLIQSTDNHDTMMRRIEILRTFVHLVQAQMQKDAHMTLLDFVEFLKRLQDYGTDIPLATFGNESGVQVMTLHGSKGLEFDHVWIAHMDQKTLTSGAGSAFTLPQSVKDRVEDRDEEVIKRQVYVAITRAKRFCTISYALNSQTGSVQDLAQVIADLPQELFERTTALETEAYIKQKNPALYVTSVPKKEHSLTIDELKDVVAKEYDNRKVSVTLLNNFFSCPWKWYFRSLLQLPEAQAISLEFGSIVHNAIEKILKEKATPTEAEIVAIIEALTDRVRGIPEFDTAAMARDAARIVNAWVQDRMGAISPNYDSEKALSYRDPKHDHLLITGKIDLLERLNDNQVRVTDFKTGKPKEAREIEKPDEEGRMSDYLRQLAMYSYLLQGTAKGDIHVAESRLEFVEAESKAKNAIYSTVVGIDAIDRLRDDIADYDRLVKNGEWVNRPCNWKPFKGESECPYCKLGKIYS